MPSDRDPWEDEDEWPRAGRFGYEGTWHREHMSSNEELSPGGPEWEVTMTTGVHIRVTANHMAIVGGVVQFWDSEDTPGVDLAYAPGSWVRVRRERTYKVP